MKEKNDIVFQLTQTLFWDVNTQTIDCDKNDAFIVERVMNMGNLHDFQIIKAYYAISNIK